MAQPKIKVTQMSLASTANAGDFLMIVQDGISKKSTLANLLKNLNSNDNIRINPTQLTIDVSIASKNDSNLFVVKGSSDKIGIGTNAPSSKLHVAGNFQVGSSAAGLAGDGVILQSTESIIYTSENQTNNAILPISAVRSSSVLICNTGVSGQFSLPSGYDGQIKTVSQSSLDAGKTSVISFTGLGANTITFDVTGNTITLQYITSLSKWIVLATYGGVLSTV